MKVEMSIGDVYDRITISRIKLNKISNKEKLKNVIKEYEKLVKLFPDDLQDDVLFKQLYEINLRIWNIEDKIRKKESLQEFDKEFIELARNVYFTNDERAELKKIINTKTNSDLVEEKEYVKYGE